ncbi:Dynein assembly factor with WDR repeat domains 1 [Eumeta japonica]|uniref:Dynein assembly factor with WDR repeat domains 1 n=1 Tax=Eumeta variegata TaxID=151549 RepID=A0A4C1TGC8_EUMVA|nr:Dynein assembly factor with WDR repeat domains 1 [Eumeta japonica]
MKLLKFHLRYHPPGITLEYLQKGVVKNKDIDILDLSSESNVQDVVSRVCSKEPLITNEVRGQLEQCVVALKKRIEHEGPSGKRFYIYKTLHTHVLPLTNVAFDKSGKRCLTGSYDRTCKVWDAEEGKDLKTLTGHQNVVYAVAFNFPVCDKVITGSFDKSAKVWDPETGECLATLWGHRGEVVVAQFSPNAEITATASMDSTAKLFDMNTGELHTGKALAEVVARQFEPTTGQRLITGSFDGTVALWDTRLKDRVAVLVGHDGEVSSCLFNWDSSLVASSSLDGSAKLWDSRERDLLGDAGEAYQ